MMHVGLWCFDPKASQTRPVWDWKKCRPNETPPNINHTGLAAIAPFPSVVVDKGLGFAQGDGPLVVAQDANECLEMWKYIMPLKDQR